jgi:LEA14-like dessication related protein
MNFDELSKEQEMIRRMRKVLTSIIREITPAPGDKYPLSKPTVEEIRSCLGLLVAREQELAKAIEMGNEEHFDEPQQFQNAGFYPKRKDN